MRAGRGITYVRSDGLHCHHMPFATFALRAVQAIGLERGDDGAVGRSICFTARIKHVGCPVFPHERSCHATKKIVLVRQIMASEAVVAIAGRRQYGGAYGNEIMADRDRKSVV